MHCRALLAVKPPLPKSNADFSARIRKSSTTIKPSGPADQLVYTTSRLALRADGNVVYLSQSSLPELFKNRFQQGVMVPSKIADRGRSKSGERISIDSLALDMPFNDDFGSWICCPVYQALPILVHKETSSFYRCDLRRLCEDQFAGSSNPNIQITRLNVRHEADPSVKSMTFYGDNILVSQLLRDLLLSPDAPATANPYTKAMDPKQVLVPGIRRVLTAYSCRLNWDDGTDKTTFVNLDRHGNFSCYFKGEDTLLLIRNILEYLHSLGALHKTTDHPLLRSQVALEKVATEPEIEIG